MLDEGSFMEIVSLDGEEWSDSSGGIPIPPPQLISSRFGEGVDIGKVDGDSDGGEILDAMISDTMDVTEPDSPKIHGEFPMDDVSVTSQESTTPVPHGTSTPQPASQPREPLQDLENDDLFWKRFDILPCAPSDHAFYDKPIAQHSRTFMARLHKEYRALSTGLPGTLISVSMTDPTPISHQPRSSYGHMRTEETFSVLSSSVQKTHPTKMPHSLSTGC
jgi:hypothetical protein